jgi:uncharacterized protein YhaN
MSKNKRAGSAGGALLILLLGAGCASTEDGTSVNAFDDIRLMSMSSDGLSDSEAKLLEQAQRNASTRIEGAAIGGIGGCVVGFFGGRAFTDNSAVVAGTTAGGCAAGALAGYAAGAYVAEVNQQAASEQADLQERIDAAKADAARYRDAANAAQRTVADLKSKVSDLNRKYAAHQITAAEYASELDSVDSSALALRVLIVESMGNIEVMEQDIAALDEKGRDTSGLKQRLAALRQENQRLVAQYEDLAQVVDLVPAEVEAPAVPQPGVA